MAHVACTLCRATSSAGTRVVRTSRLELQNIQKLAGAVLSADLKNMLLISGLMGFGFRDIPSENLGISTTDPAPCTGIALVILL